MPLSEKRKLSLEASEIYSNKPVKTEPVKEPTNEVEKEQTPPQEAKNIENKSEYINHVVSPGETLWKIAQKYNVDYKEIIEINNIKNANSLLKGQILKIKKKS